MEVAGRVSPGFPRRQETEGEKEESKKKKGHLLAASNINAGGGGLRSSEKRVARMPSIERNGERGRCFPLNVGVVGEKGPPVARTGRGSEKEN